MGKVIDGSLSSVSLVLTLVFLRTEEKRKK